MSYSIIAPPLRMTLLVFAFSCANRVLAEDPPAAPQAEDSKSVAEKLDQLAKWSKGPLKGDLGQQSSIQVPAGFRFSAGKECQKVLEAFENRVSGNELGVVGPDDLDWMVVFEFDDVGYVKDDEKDKLDADEMLKQRKAGSVEANKDRVARGWTPIEVLGWHTPPRYDPETNNLTWAVHNRSDGVDFTNYNTRLLGRHGVMEVTLVADLEDMDRVLPEFKKLLKTHEFNSGNKYAEFRSGDRVAAYGLTALMGVGAAAVALKTGLLQKFWKLIVGAVVVIGAGIAKVWNSIFGRKDASVR